MVVVMVVVGHLLSATYFGHRVMAYCTYKFGGVGG
jgi:hypothetical protein